MINSFESNLKISKLSANSSTFKLSYGSNRDLKKKKVNEIEEYIEYNYTETNCFELDKLINDLNAFKAYRDNLYLNIQFESNLLTLASLIIAFLTATLMPKNISVERTVSILKIILYIITGIVIYVYLKYFERLSCFKSIKIDVVNNGIYILESIRDDIYNNPIQVPKTREFDIEVDNVVGQVSEPRNYSVKVKESLEDRIKLLAEKNKKEYLRNIMEKKLFEPYGIEVDGKGVISYKDSNDIKNELTTKSKEYLASYISDKYCNVIEHSREDILKDLAIFKNLRKTLELEYRSYEAFIKNIAFIIAILSFAITSTKEMIPAESLPCLAKIILGVSLAYLIGTGRYLVKIVDRKSGPGKLDVIEYGINVLEIKLEELDRNQDK